MLKKKNISVSMATYNGEKFIRQQLDSIINEIGIDDEIIISDDSSNDNTVSIIKSYNDKRIKLFENQKFKSPLLNFEFAISHAVNDLIFLSDQDDLWVKGRVEIMKTALEHADLVVSDFSIIDESNNIILPSYFTKYPLRAKPGIIRNLWRHSFSGCCMAFRKEILKKALPFPKDVYTYHDFWIGFVANLFYKIKFIQKPLTLYRSHTNNVSSGSKLKSSNSIYNKILFRWNIIKHLPSLFLR